MISHRCAAHGALRGLFDAARHATIAAHVRQTSLKQYAPERAPKVLVENRVDRRIQCRVHVPEPKGYREGHIRYVTCRTRRLRDVQYEERQPARNETAHNQAQNQGGAFLLLARNATLLLFGITRFHRFRRQHRLQFGHLDVRLPLVHWCCRCAAAAARRRCGRDHTANDTRIIHHAAFRTFCIRFLAEYRLTEPKFQRFDDRTTTDYARIRTGRIEFANHVDVNTNAERSAPCSTGVAGAQRARRDFRFTDGQ